MNHRILILGASGMLGHTLFRYFSQHPDYDAFGTLRNRGMLRYFNEASVGHIITDVDVLNEDALLKVIATIKPDTIINCVGVIKQLESAKDPLYVLPINALLPHRLTHITALSNTRLIHISTDCVYAGNKGMYVEEDVSDAGDLYGKSKFLGEVDAPHAITLRTSIIGRELSSNIALVDWFLSQEKSVKGFTRAIYSGFPTIELAHIIEKHVIPYAHLSGLYHVSSDPIDKYALLTLIADIYDKKIMIEPCDQLRIDRSLDSSRFRRATDYQPPSWRDLILKMKEFE